MDTNSQNEPGGNPKHPGFSEALRFWIKLGWISFGGPTGQIAITHEELVEKKKWISESRFLHALNYCMLLPGPEAQQLAVYIGWLLHRTPGGIAAGALFVLPSMLILWILSVLYVEYGSVYWVAGIFSGLKPAVAAIVAVAVYRLGRKALKNEIMWAIAAVSFLSIFFLKVAFPWIILGAGITGLLGSRVWKRKFLAAPKDASHSNVIDDTGELLEHTKPNLWRALRILTVCLLLWWIPIILIAAWQSNHSTLFIEGVFFSKAAMVTFGGAYAVLPYVAQQAVESYGWLKPGEMLDGLGFAETTPGPLIMVLQFVGFMGAWNNPGSLNPLVSASLGALITTWVTFIPCFMWIFLGGPYIEKLRGNTILSAPLSAITPAVVGVVLNLAVWFGIHTMFPRSGQVNWFGIFVGIAALAGILRWNWSVALVVLGGGLLGLVYGLFMLP